jgi:hypothetical protein
MVKERELKYSEVSEELQRKIDRRIVEVHEQYPKWGSRRIASFVSEEFKIKVFKSVVERNIPEWRERKREWNRKYRERRRKGIKERKRERARRYRERIRPYGRKILRIYKLNERLDDDEIVSMMLELVGDVVSKKRVRTIIRWCRRARKSGEQRYIDHLSKYLGLSGRLIREELGIGYKIRVGSFREVYECLVALGGVATFKELQERLGWDPRVLSTCLKNIKQNGLSISGERRFVRSLLPDFTAPGEGLMVWYLPEKQREAEERARTIALEKLELSFRSFFKSRYKAERSRKEAEKLIPLLRKVYEERGLSTIRELMARSDCRIDTDNLKVTLKGYADRYKAFHIYGSYLSFSRQKIEGIRTLNDFVGYLFQPLFTS